MMINFRLLLFKTITYTYEFCIKLIKNILVLLFIRTLWVLIHLYLINNYIIKKNPTNTLVIRKNIQLQHLY